MNYLKIYNNLIEKSFNRKLKVYTERHHIIPRCIGGADDTSNLAILTPEEHYLAHQLLVKIYPNEPKLVYAVNIMLVNSANTNRNNKTFGWIRKKLSAVISSNNSGKTAPNKNIPMTAEQKIKLSTKWEFTFPDGHKETHTGLKEFCELHKLNASAMSAVCKGKRSHHKGFTCVKIDKIKDGDNLEYTHKPNLGWKVCHNRIPVLINGIRYKSIHLACMNLKISRKKVEQLNEYKLRKS